jgi:phosphoribosylformylglycinamidine synthase
LVQNFVLLDQNNLKRTAQARFDNYKNQALNYTFLHFTGKKVIDASQPRPKRYYP